MKFLALLLFLVFLCACQAPRTDIGNGAIKVRFSDSEAFQAAWEHSTGTIYVTSHAGHAWLAHEALHACDSMNLSMHQVLDLVGPLKGYEGDVALARRVANAGGTWTALYKLCGPQAVRHPEILSAIKLGKR